MTIKNSPDTSKVRQFPTKRTERIEQTCSRVSEDEIDLEVASGYREILPDVYCDEDRTLLYDRAYTDGKNGKRQVYFRPRRLQLSGMPRLISCYIVDERGSEQYDALTYYHVDWSRRDDRPSETFTEAQLNTGEWLAHWPGIPATRRTDRDFYANVVKGQLRAFDIPVGSAKRRTGFHKDKVSQLWAYYLRDGRIVSPSLEISETHIPIRDYDFANKHPHIDAWLEHMQTPPVTPASNSAQSLFSWLENTVDPHGRPLLLCLDAYRSLINSFEAIGTAALIVANDELSDRDGSSGAGKTTSVDFARGVDGPCPYKSPPEAGYKGSLAGIETRVKAFNDVPISIADFHLDPSASEKDLVAWADKLDAFVSSAADKKEVKERATKDMQARAGTVISGFLFMDGEKLKPLLLSRLRRVQILQYRRGEINTDAMHAEWIERQSVHTAIGHAIIRKTILEVNQSESAFVRTIREKEQKYADHLFNRYMEEHMDADKEIIRSLALNFARPVTGAYLADKAVTIPDLIETAKRLAYRHLQAQASLMQHGGPSTVDREWIIRTTNFILEKGYGHTLTVEEEELNEADHGRRLQKWGYKPTTNVEKPWIRGGLYLLNFSDDQKTCWFISETWNELLKERAVSDRIKWTYTSQTFPGAMVAMGIVEPKIEAEKQRSTHRLRIAGKLERRLLVRADILSLDNGDDEKERSQRSQRSQEGLSQDTGGFAQHEAVTASFLERSQRSQEGLSQDADGFAQHEAVTAVTACSAEELHQHMDTLFPNEEKSEAEAKKKTDGGPPQPTCPKCGNPKDRWEETFEYWFCSTCTGKELVQSLEPNSQVF